MVFCYAFTISFEATLLAHVRFNKNIMQTHGILKSHICYKVWFRIQLFNLGQLSKIVINTRYIQKGRLHFLLDINNPWDETRVKHILTVNKEFLIEEMDTEMMRRKLYKKTGRKCYSIMNAPLLRKEKAEQIFQNVKKEPPKIIDTVFLKETKMHLIRERLQASDRIFRYKHGK